MTITEGNGNNGNGKPRLKPPTWRDVAGGLMLAGLIIYVLCVITEVI